MTRRRATPRGEDAEQRVGERAGQGELDISFSSSIFSGRGEGEEGRKGGVVLNESERAQRGYRIFKTRQKEDEEKEAVERWRKLEEMMKKEPRGEMGAQKGGTGGDGEAKAVDLAMASPSETLKEQRKEKEEYQVGGWVK